MDFDREEREVLEAFETDELKPVADKEAEMRKHREYAAAMKNREQIMKILQDNREHLRTEFGVERIGLFGSYSKGTAQAGSDIDLVIEFAHPIGFRFVELAEYLETLLGAPVDILTPEGVAGIRVPQVAAEIQNSVVYV